MLKYKIPITLIYSRLCIGFGMIILSSIRVNHYSFIAISFLTIGLLTDVFDGIIARQLKISSPHLRRLDSTVDQVFFVSAIIATYIQSPVFFKSNAAALFILFGIESITYIVCYIKFRKEIATHSIGAKIWTLLLFAALAEVIIYGKSAYLFTICLWVGIISRLEIIAIILCLKTWTNDVPTLYHAIKLRKGKEIKRNKLFNG